jgi:nicotinamidase-related amidase
VVVDAQHIACEPTLALGPDPVDAEGAAYAARVAQALANTATLLATCRHLELPIIHVRTAAQRADGKDLSRHLHALGICPVQGTPAAAFMPTVMPQPEEIILTKPGLGIFTGTGLDECLRNLAIEHLLLTGISFAGGLEGSIRSASDRGYGVVIVPDSCATFHPLLQAQLYKLESGIINVHETAVLNAQLQAMRLA